MSGLGMSILQEGWTKGELIGEARGELIGEARGEARGVEIGVTLSAAIFKEIQSGEQDNAVIAARCGCTEEKVERVRKAFGI